MSRAGPSPARAMRRPPAPPSRRQEEVRVASRKGGGSKNSASKQSLNPVGDFQGTRQGQVADQVAENRDEQIPRGEVGQYSGEGTPPLQKR